MDIIKILAICIISAVLIIILKGQKPEYSFFISVSSVILILSLITAKLLPAMEEIKLLIDASGIDTEYFKTALKALFIAYLTEFVANTCRDFGQSSLASKAELAGRAAIFIISIPLLSTVLKTALSFKGG